LILPVENAVEQALLITWWLICQVKLPSKQQLEIERRWKLQLAAKSKYQVVARAKATLQAENQELQQRYAQKSK
jgi:hypothetical protein